LAKAIIAPLQDRERAGAMGKGGNGWRDTSACPVEYPIPQGGERMVQETEALYEELIGEKMGVKYVDGEWQMASGR